MFVIASFTPVLILTPQLAPGETREVEVVANPRSTGLCEAELVCLIDNNPKPVVVNLQCLGARPAVSVSSKALTFDRLLLGRQDSQQVTLHNPSPLTVYWRVNVGVMGKSLLKT